ncbi:MAG TPA: argininosuccinate lyase [Deinococcales bacterium]|nr:argininosuccinate lyase [Deinococcales bacterium]
MPKNPWGGRFSERTDDLVQEFNASLPFDRRLVLEDVRGSQAHVTMLGETGILTAEEARSVHAGLERVLAEVRSGEFPWRVELEDIHMNVETRLRELIGPVAGKLHTARSRNDQVATDFRLWVKDACRALEAQIGALRRVLAGQAVQHSETVMPGYTHLQVAQPIVLGHWFLAYEEMLARDAGRFRDARERMDESPLGAGALAGTGWPIDRERTAGLLGFARPARNSLDAVGSRDFALEFLAACSIAMAHLSRLSEELILYSSAEFGFVTLPDAFTTGSSIMPQKKNPDVCELARGKAGRVFGDLLGLLTTVKGTPLAYNKDLQEDKEPVFDAFDTLSVVLRLYAAMLPRATWHEAVMLRAAGRGYSTATDLADLLARRGLPFREAHEVVGKLVGACVASGRDLWDLTPEELTQAHPLLDESARAALTVQSSVNARQSLGGTAPARVKEAAQAALSRIEKEEA